MAGETKGVAYEAITKLALDTLKAEGKLKGRIFWGEKPEDMTIKPDLTIGRSSNAPEVSLLITHSGAAGNSHMKYWRNMGELVESKVFLPAPARVFNLAFDSVIKEDLKKVQEASFDGQLIVGDRPYGNELQSWIDSNLSGFPKDKEEKVEYLRDLLITDDELKRLHRLLKKDLELLLKKKAPPELDRIWLMERARKKGKSPARKETFVRRGLSKMLIFEDLDLALRLYTWKNVQQNEIPLYAHELGLACKAIGRAKPSDEEILNAVSSLGPQVTKRILKMAPVGKMDGWLVSLRNAPHLTLMGQYIIDHFEKLCEPASLEKLLKSLHRDPSALVKGYKLPPNWPPKTVWLFDFIVEILKANGGNANSYGYAQMARQMAKLPDMPSASNRVYSIVLSDWLLRRNRETLPAQVLSQYARLLSGKLLEIGATQIERLVSKLKRLIYNNLIEAKLCTYRGFEPLADCIRNIAPKSKLLKIQTCFAEKALHGGQAGKTTVLQASSTLINWQSAHHSHTNDKKKELCGRAVALRYSWDSKTNTFIPRPGIKKLILVLDGTWKQGDLDALVRAGWDEIFYPDEMDKLAKAIV